MCVTLIRPLGTTVKGMEKKNAHQCDRRPACPLQSLPERRGNTVVLPVMRRLTLGWVIDRYFTPANDNLKKTPTNDRSTSPYPNDVRDREGGRVVHQRAVLGEEVPPQRRQLPVGPSSGVRGGEGNGMGTVDGCYKA